MRMEYQRSQPFLSVTGYIAPAATGTLRMYNNRRWFSDITRGAGLGMTQYTGSVARYTSGEAIIFLPESTALLY